MGGEAVPKAVRCEANRQPGLSYGFLYRALDALFVNVVPPDVAAARVLREIVRHKDILPAPLKGSPVRRCTPQATAAAGSAAPPPGESFEAYHPSSIGVIYVMIAWRLWAVKPFF